MSTPTHDDGKVFGSSAKYREGWDHIFLKTADEWLATEKYSGYNVLDPDGWDRSNFNESWAEKITEEEFLNRLHLSTSLVRLN